MQTPTANDNWWAVLLTDRSTDQASWWPAGEPLADCSLGREFNGSVKDAAVSYLDDMSGVESPSGWELAAGQRYSPIYSDQNKGRRTEDARWTPRGMI